MTFESQHQQRTLGTELIIGVGGDVESGQIVDLGKPQTDRVLVNAQP